MARRAVVDPALVHARRVVYSADSTRTFVAGGYSETVLAFAGNAETVLELTGESAPIGDRIGALACADSVLYALTETSVTLLTDAAVPVVTDTYPVDAAATANWIFVFDGCLIVPVRN